MFTEESSKIRKSLSKNIARVRKMKLQPSGQTWSQAHLAKVAGLSIGTVQKIESGATWPDWKTVVRLAEVLEVHVDELYGNMNTLEDAIELLNCDSLKLTLGLDDSNRAKLTVNRVEQLPSELDNMRYKGIFQLPVDVLKELSSVSLSKKRVLILKAALGLDISHEEVSLEWLEKSTKITSQSGEVG